MDIPFTYDQFMQIFRNYNLSVWPFQIVLNLLAIAGVVLAIQKTKASDVTISSILGFFWLWIGVAYKNQDTHWLPIVQVGWFHQIPSRLWPHNKKPVN